jgi:hypothetical protein
MKTKMIGAGSVKLAIVIALVCVTWAGSAIAQRPDRGKGQGKNKGTHSVRQGELMEH